MKALGCAMALAALLVLFCGLIAGLLGIVSGPVAVTALAIALCGLVIGTEMMTEGEIHDDL